jgi:DNA-binding MarR family transcriptional regulator
MDELLLSKVRLTVVAELLAAEWVSFSELQRSADTTNGNLGGHLGKLAAADYIEEEKRFRGRRPQTRYRLTPTGRKALLHHVAALQELVDGERERP